MSGREVREYTNLSDPKDKKSGKGKDRIDDEDINFQRMVAKGSWLVLLVASDDEETDTPTPFSAAITTCSSPSIRSRRLDSRQDSLAMAMEFGSERDGYESRCVCAEDVQIVEIVGKLVRIGDRISPSPAVGTHLPLRPLALTSLSGRRSLRLWSVSCRFLDVDEDDT
ncbi:hypothetical protein L1987_23805 [Smallanthus sonchifolius]|uniref:Uncharacterized protein n=1 Tax=Smallanthus sonchifolius TaxID=185202 RepID=A0ACB9IIP0_9ASTR|nr:hypothetical protein L1987_23805 [Smallanthus sonchifolius]